MKLSEAHALLDSLDESVLRECVGKIAVAARRIVEHAGAIKALPQGSDKLEVVRKALDIGTSVESVMEDLFNLFPSTKASS